MQTAQAVRGDSEVISLLETTKGCLSGTRRPAGDLQRFAYLHPQAVLAALGSGRAAAWAAAFAAVGALAPCGLLLQAGSLHCVSLSHLFRALCCCRVPAGGS